MTDRQPNIVWIQCDDMSRDVATYGRTPGVSTPNIDRLAAEGVRFDRAYSTAPTCAPSRSAQLTGQYMTAVNGQHHHSTPEYPPHVKHLAERLKEVGYFPANISKNKPGLPEIGWGKLDYCWDRNTADEFYDSDDYADLAPNQPFYAEFQTIEPHLPWHSLAKYAEVGLAVDPADVELPPFYPDTPETREEWARYLSDVQVFDAKVGMVIQMLEEDGLLEDTIVILVADHGRDMVRAKFALYDDGIHIPLIMRIPAKYQPEGYTPGQSTDQIVSGVDIIPTILATLGMEVPTDLPGTPVFGPNRAERRYAFA
ncbi:MAG: sulfatase family protein, partial [Acidimicrobiia bacterium]